MDAISLSLYPIIIRDRIFLSRGVFDLQIPAHLTTHSAKS